MIIFQKKKMSDNEDPYAVSSDSDDDETLKKPPPKINIEGRQSNINDLRAAITEKKENIKDESKLAEIEEIKKAKAAELVKMKKNFESGCVHNAESGNESDSKSMEKLPGIDKDKLTAFKSKFEKLQHTENDTLDDHLKILSLEGTGKENLSQMKKAFENVQRGEITVADIGEGKIVNLDCSEADRRRIMAAFIGPKSEDNIPKNCALCNKTVYPVERLFANKQLYHIECFRCKICNKKLSATQYNINDDVLYCKQHYMEVLYPDRTYDVNNEEIVDESNEDDEFATVSKPKQLSSDIVRAGTNINDELQQIKSLKEKKACFLEFNANQENNERKKDEILETITGSVKDRMSKIIAGGDKSSDDIEEREEKMKQLESIKTQVGEIKNKWKTGDIEKAEAKDAEIKNEIEELRKGGINLRQRLNEHLEPPTTENTFKTYNREELDTSNVAEARKSFLHGLAYQSGPVEKTAKDIEDIKFNKLDAFKDKFEKGEEEKSDNNERQLIDIDIQLKNIKQQLEKGIIDEANMTPEERAEHKKKEIEAEFLRYKLARKLQAKKAQEVTLNEDNEAKEAEEKSFLDVEVKMAGKAREKFKNIEAQNPNSVPIPKLIKSNINKKSKKDENNVEVVNRRVAENASSDEDDENAFDVKNLMNKFKNIQNSITSKVEKTNLEELEIIRKQAKNLREQFESKNEADNENNEEKNKQLAEEFQRLKQEREKMQEELKAEEFERKIHREIEKEEIQVTAAHASKMAAKWEKIHKKEAKKAEKSRMPSK